MTFLYISKGESLLYYKQCFGTSQKGAGLPGWICLDDCVSGTWLVNFPQCGEKDDIAEISIEEEDLMQIPVMHADMNEQIKVQFDAAEKEKKAEEIRSLPSADGGTL